MSNQIDAGLVKAYQANIAMAVQQKMSRLRGAVTVESSPNAEFVFKDRVGTVAAQKRTGRNVEVTYTDTPHDRRRVGMSDFFVADTIDKKDKIRMIADPTSVYVRTFASAMNRAIDDALIAAAFDTVYTGKEGTTALTFAQDNGKNVPYDQIEGAAGTGGGTDASLTVLKLRKTRVLLDKAEVSIEDNPDLFIVCPPEAIEALLRDNNVTSTDFNTVQALVAGTVDSFMGFKFIKSNRLPVYSTNKQDCIAFAREGMLLNVGEDIFSSVDVLPGRHFVTQVYSSMSVGTVRMWGERVVKVSINNTK